MVSIHTATSLNHHHTGACSPPYLFTPSLFPALFLPFFVVPPALFVELRTWIEPAKPKAGSADEDGKAEVDATTGVKSCFASDELDDDDARDSQDMMMMLVVMRVEREAASSWSQPWPAPSGLSDLGWAAAARGLDF